MLLYTLGPSVIYFFCLGTIEIGKEVCSLKMFEQHQPMTIEIFFTSRSMDSQRFASTLGKKGRAPETVAHCDANSFQYNAAGS